MKKALVRLALASLFVSGSALAADGFAPPVKAQGRRFVDAQGREVLLRGINVAGDSKMPPFMTYTEKDLDPLPKLGFNTIRLLFNWEAYEPLRGFTKADYLEWLHRMAQAASDRGLYVIVDFHQDGFSRYQSRGCGSGFPRWAVFPSITVDQPDNGEACTKWGLLMATDPSMHRSFNKFYGNDDGVRQKFIELWGTLARTFSDIPGVIGYDVLNEPWGFENKEILPLYKDAAKVIRAAHPKAILFLEPELKVGLADLLWFGNQTNMENPEIDNIAYAPHYYQIGVSLSGKFDGNYDEARRGFERMQDISNKWNVPVFVGEFGTSPAYQPNSAYPPIAYMNMVYQFLDYHSFSGAQWTYTPAWNPQTFDGWNREDFSITDNNKQLRPQYRYRIQPQAIAGEIISIQESLGVDHKSTMYKIKWAHDPKKGDSVFFIPSSDSGVRPVAMTTEGNDLNCSQSLSGMHYVCQSKSPGLKSLTFTWL